jgi:cell division protein ZapA
MTNQAVEIEILGKLTRVNCPIGEEESLRKAASDLDNRLKEMTARTKVANVEKLLTIAALNACYELQQSKVEQESEQQVLNQRIEALSQSLEDVLRSTTKE